MKTFHGLFVAMMVATACLLSLATAASAQSHRDVVAKSKSMVPSPPWSKGDQVGMANTLGLGTWMRCAQHLTNAKSRSYEVSHLRSNTMPLSPFGVPLKYKFRPTASVPYSKHAFNGEHLESGEPGAQGTQMDALGHFAYLENMWKGEGAIPVDTASYYGGYKQGDVKPNAASPLLKLGIENVPPIITSAVLLDAKSHLGGGKAMQPGQLVTTADIEAMLAAQGLGWRGLLPGDVLYIYTGWSDHWKDPDVEKVYYTKGPGLSYDAAKYLKEKAVVLVALDNPFTDPVFEGQLVGKHGPAEGTPPGLPFAIHHENLAVSGIHQIQNAKLAAMAKDKVWTSCTIILPLRSKGGSGSPVRPVAIGAPGQS
ncbi:MAG: cyclase family protein [Alphaproteobacteria bacterium]|jgi:kynurenine formamidase